MKIATFETERDVARATAERIASAIREHPDIVLSLAAGRTPVATYEELVHLYRTGAVDFSRATFFGLDEFAGVNPEHPGTFHQYLHRHLFSQVNVSASRIHLLNGIAPDLETECDRYEAEIAAAGGIELMLLGIGANGHIGFNEPGETLAGRTHVVELHSPTRRDNAESFGGEPGRVPARALSMGMATILHAATILLLATGRRKARCVEQAIRGPLTTRLPASFLQTHHRVELYLDREAASLLREPPEAWAR